MSNLNYESWMTKYRPVTFDHVVGQTPTVHVLKGMLKRQSILPSIIITGSHGIGKTSLARILSKNLLCQNPTSEGLSCHLCGSCTSFDANTNINYLEKDAASSGKVADIRDLVKLCSFPPMNSARRVIVLDEAHRVTSEGWNALLKTLEEAVSYTVFIFCTTEPDKILETVKSRSRIFPLILLSQPEIMGRLEQILKAEGIVEYDADAVLSISSLCSGHLRDAINTLEQCHQMGSISLPSLESLIRRVDHSRIKSALEQTISDPRHLFDQIQNWLQLMAPSEIAIAVHDIVIKHQMSLWKIEPNNSLDGWGDSLNIMQWLSANPVPVSVTQLNSFIVQLISRLNITKKEVAVKEEVSISDQEPRKALPEAKPRPDPTQRTMAQVTKRPAPAVIQAIPDPIITPPPSELPVVEAPALPVVVEAEALFVPPQTSISPLSFLAQFAVTKSV